MTKKPNLSNAVARINDRGALLVFPIDNRPLPLSLWSEFHPKTKMRWVWDDGGDNRVHDMWVLMKRLSDCREVVYSKWYQGRATFFSQELFTAMLSVRRTAIDPRKGLSEHAREMLDVLEGDSPLSTRQLKEAVGLQGRINEGLYNKALKELFSRLLVVAYGEIEDGSFPSLAVGATSLLFEDICRDAEELSRADAQATIDRLLPEGSHFRKYFDKSGI